LTFCSNNILLPVERVLFTAACNIHFVFKKMKTILSDDKSSIFEKYPRASKKYLVLFKKYHREKIPETHTIGWHT
jgi:hypothetical protein